MPEYALSTTVISPEPAPNQPQPPSPSIRPSILWIVNIFWNSHRPTPLRFHCSSLLRRQIDVTYTCITLFMVGMRHNGRAKSPGWNGIRQVMARVWAMPMRWGRQTGCSYKIRVCSSLLFLTTYYYVVHILIGWGWGLSPVEICSVFHLSFHIVCRRCLFDWWSLIDRTMGDDAKPPPSRDFQSLHSEIRIMVKYIPEVPGLECFL